MPAYPDFLIYALLFLTGVTPAVNLLLILFWKTNFKSGKNLSENYPRVSVLIAARNEAANLPDCLNALLAVDYPKDKLEILIGNDASQDETLQIARAYAAKHPHIKVFDIHKEMGSAKGKANVLAQLAHEAKGEVFLITDADIEVPGSWVKGILSYYTPEIGLITGITSIKSRTLLGRLQHFDWLLALGMVKVVTDLSRPVTAMGNNMLVSREAYFSTGGYERIPFSVTEDFALFKAIYTNGYQVRQLISPEVNVWTKPAVSVGELLHQRKRWMSGAMQLPLQITALLGVQALFFPLIISLSFFYPAVALGLLLFKSATQALFIALVQRKLRQKIEIFIHFLYESYSFLLSLSLMLFYLLPVRIKWKGRKY